MAQEKAKIVVEVHGGAVVGVYGTESVLVAVVDLDGPPTSEVYHPEPWMQMVDVTHELADSAFLEDEEAEGSEATDGA